MPKKPAIAPVVAPAEESPAERPNTREPMQTPLAGGRYDDQGKRLEDEE